MPQNSLRQTQIIDRNATRYLHLKTSSYYLRKRFSRSALQTTSKQSRYWEFKFSLRTLNTSKALAAADLFKKLIDWFELDKPREEKSSREVLMYIKTTVKRQLDGKSVDSVLASMSLNDPISEAHELAIAKDNSEAYLNPTSSSFKQEAEKKLLDFLGSVDLS